MTLIRTSLEQCASVEHTEMNSYCGGYCVVIDDVLRLEDVDTSWNNVFDHPDEVDVLIDVCYEDAYEKLLITPLTHPQPEVEEMLRQIAVWDICLTTAGRTFAILLPPEFGGPDMPPLPTIEQGTVFQNLIYSAYDSRYTPNDVPPKYTWCGWKTWSEVGTTDRDDYHAPLETGVYARDDEGGYTLGSVMAHDSLPWFCPDQGRHDPRDMINAMINTAVRAGHQYTFVFDVVDPMTNIPTAPWIAMSYLLHECAGQKYIQLGKKRVYFDVFMPNGTNVNYDYHLTCGMLLSLTPITQG